MYSDDDECGDCVECGRPIKASFERCSDCERAHPMDERTEARSLVAAMSLIELHNAGDRRFLESWKGYLARTGDGANIGCLRMFNLQRVASTYGLCLAPAERPEPPGLNV
jgi:hypothetical protein